LTNDQRATLASCQDWLEDFEHFLLHVPHEKHGKVCSEANTKTVMRQVVKMVSGQGVSYQHWPEGVVFLEGQPIQLSNDFFTLHQQAQEFEDLHGEDRGHGWLTRHPLDKLRCYQAYKIEQQEQDTSKQAIED
jgi:hypothetical protein